MDLEDSLAVLDLEEELIFRNWWGRDSLVAIQADMDITDIISKEDKEDKQPILSVLEEEKECVLNFD